MSYCVKCGHELIEKENGIDGMVPYCPNCQEFRFPMFNSAVSALVLNPKKDKILLIQQYGHKDNILIAGYVTKGENAKQALFREIKEETGLTISSYEFNDNEYYARTNTYKLLFCKWVVIIRLFTMFRAHCISISHFFWRQNCHFYKF